MNRKYFLCIPFMEFLLITSQSFSMHKVIFTASRKKKDEKMIREVYSKFAPGHPYLLDRVAMIEKYIQKWDEEHKHEKNNE